LQTALNEMTLKLAASAITGGRAPRPGDDAEYSTAFSAYARTGDGESGIKASQFKGPRAAMSIGSNPDGGLLAPVEWDRTITDKLKIISAMRGLARVISISTSGFTKVYNDRATQSGWVGESANRPGTGNAQFAQVNFGTGELYAMPIASQQLLEDALIDIESWLGDEVQTEFAFQEGVAFVSGNGATRPKGFLQYTDAASHPWGAIPTVNTGVAADVSADGLIDLVHDLPSERTPNATFVMNRKTQGRIRKLKDGQGRYLWEPSTQVGDPATILGFPVSELAAMPDVAANTIPIAFGDWERGYLIVDRIGVQILRDPYSQKPFVQFYTRKRVGGGVTDPTCLRYHKVAANA
jgi:HK97 family phage major capsid protein